MVLLALAASGAHLASPVSAVVVLPSYKLIVSVNPGSSAGSVALTPAGGTYAAGTTVSFKATANTGWYFVAWALNYSDTDSVWGNEYSAYYSNQNPASLAMNRTYILTAYFQQQNQWTRYAGNPILTGTLGAWDQSEAWGPQVFQYPNGTYGMIYNGYSSATGEPAIGLATSSDGLTWNKYPGNPILTRNSSASAWDRMGIKADTAFYDDSQGLYLMYYSAVNTTSHPLASGIGLATSSDSVHWTRYTGNPLVTGSEYYLRESVVKYGNTYMMWYSFDGAIYLYTSSDSKHWTVQNGGGPVFKPDSYGFPGNGANPNAWDFDFSYRPNVVYDPLAENFKMTYSACDVSCEGQGALFRIGLAVSTDGITWTKYPGNPIVAPVPGAWDNGDGTDNAGLLWLNGTLRVYYSGHTFSSASCIDQHSGCYHYVTWGIGLLYAQEVPLTLGWNFLSLPVVPASNDLKTILKSLLSANEVTAVWAYSAASKTWSFYKPLPTPSGTLSTMQDGVGYWIYMTKPDTLIVGGYVIAPVRCRPRIRSIMVGT